MELHKTKLMVAKKRFLLCRGQDTIVLKNCVGLQVRKLVLQLEKIRHDSVGICDGFSEDSKYTPELDMFLRLTVIIPSDPERVTCAD